MSTETAVDGVVEFSPAVHADTRGLFTSPLREPDFTAALGRPLFPVRDISHNVSAAGVLRGIHYTAAPPGRAKYVYVPHGRVLDFVVDLRVGSPTFGAVHTTELDGTAPRALYVPVGVGHAFLSLQDGSVVVYVMSGGYLPEHELAVSTLDPEVGLALPDGTAPRRSPRDEQAPTLRDALAAGLLPEYYTSRVVEDDLWAALGAGEPT
ncbi:dTDP-4-dehydrorhamnose 3,5-epimerase family protein [Pseudonocardia nematodicida]|uniref:dTDP-4-dehydrorhamnose 3,5-epimerase family protein n=1 Tax=Pseudonocardia nematodicida TaxID=1206997 RepID=A0ABV1KEA6_9PSEU